MRKAGTRGQYLCLEEDSKIAAWTSVDVEEIKRKKQIVEEYESFLKRKQSESPAETAKLRIDLTRNRWKRWEVLKPSLL